jgi:hypothetical protein
VSGPLLAHAGGSDEIASTLLVFAGLWVAWVAWGRLRGRGFSRLPKAAAWAMVPGSLLLIAAAVVVPPLLFGPGTGRQVEGSSSPATGPRPSSAAELSVRRPRAGELVSQDTLVVVLELKGGTIADVASNALQPDVGHIHVQVDGKSQSASFGTVQSVDVSGLLPGEHALEAEFVAADHAPFDPRVVAETTFEVGR